MTQKTNRQPTQEEIRESVAMLGKRALSNSTRITKLRERQRQEERRLSRKYQKLVDPLVLANKKLGGKVGDLQRACRSPEHPGWNRTRRYGTCPDCRSYVHDDRDDGSSAHP